jgi:hypothetical protein
MNKKYLIIFGVFVLVVLAIVILMSLEPGSGLNRFLEGRQFVRSPDSFTVRHIEMNLRSPEDDNMMASVEDKSWITIPDDCLDRVSYNRPCNGDHTNWDERNICESYSCKCRFSYPNSAVHGVYTYKIRCQNELYENLFVKVAIPKGYRITEIICANCSRTMEKEREVVQMASYYADGYQLEFTVNYAKPD